MSTVKTAETDHAAALLVIGGINIDIIAEPGGPVVPGSSNPGTVTVHPGGVARNIAEFLSRLSVPVSLSGSIGDDPLSRFVLDRTGESGVDISGVQVGPGGVGKYVTIQEEGDILVAVSDATGVETLDPAALMTILLPLQERLPARGRDILVIDCNLRADTLHAAIAWANEVGMYVVVEPVSVTKALRLTGAVGAVDLITPNRAEWEALCAAADVLPPVRHAAVTCGGEGAILYHRHSEGGDSGGTPDAQSAGAGVKSSAVVKAPSGGRRYPARTVRAMNANGAGDAFVAGMVWALTQEADLRDPDWDRVVCAGLIAGRWTVMSPETVPADISAQRLTAELDRG